MASFNSWISALRPRTLFLALGTAITGSGIAYATGRFSIIVCVLTILLANTLQLLSNLANDLGDYQHGTDTTGERIGPKRTMQSGAITLKEMKRAIFITAGIAALIGLALVYIALQFMHPIYIILFIVLGGASIVAAIKYTAGKNPYGYKGLGDIFSFIFFGPVCVVGTYFLHTHSFDFQPWLPSIALGLLTAAVLNINNMRDADNDQKSGKITLAVRLGEKRSKNYHAILGIGAFLCFLAYNVIYTQHWYNYIYLIVFLLFAKIQMNIYNTSDKRELDPYLKFTSIGTCLLSICFIIFINL